MKKFFVFLLFCSPFVASAQIEHKQVLDTMFGDIMLNGKSYTNLRVLTKKIGNRISGSPAAEQAVFWGLDALKEAGADSVWLQAVLVPQWVRGKESLQIWHPTAEKYIDMKMLSLGNSEGTKGVVLEREILYFNNLEEFEAVDEKEIKGNFVFFNYKFRQEWYSTFQAYGDAVKYRSVAVNKAAEKGAAGVIIRSMSTRTDDVPHTGMTRYYDGVPKIPAVTIGNESADLLASLCKQGKVKAKLQSECTMKGMVQSYNVIGELKGSEFPNEYIVVGGHLDSWDVGEGAHDDGAGCVQSIEVIRTFRKLKIQPRHTIRVVLFMNEENGMKGGLAYADSALANNEKHILAIESDAGGFSPRGIGLVMPEEMKTKVRTWGHLFLPYGVYDFSKEEGGVDISPLKRQAVPLAGLIPDQQRYFEIHHNEMDVFEAVNHRELKIGAWTMTAFIYLWDREMKE